MARQIEIRVPDMGGFKDVAVIDVLVKPGDTIAIDTPLVTLETDKATMDVPATAAGVIEKVHVNKGGKISEGDLVVTVKAEGEGAAPAPQKKEPAPTPPPPAQAAAPKPAPAAAPRSAAPAAPPATPATPATPKGEPVSADIRVPDMGGFKGVAVIDVLVKPGDAIAIDTPLVTLETDKATMDVPSTLAGVVEKVHIAKGGKVSEGDLIATVKTQGGQTPEIASAQAPAAAAPNETPPAPPDGSAQSEPVERRKTPRSPTPENAAHWPDEGDGEARAVIGGRNDLPPINEPGFSRAHAGPSVRMLARELGVDLAQVKGSGIKGRITHDDVKAFVKQILSSGAAAHAGGSGSALPAVPTVDFAKFGLIEIKPLSRIQRISGPRLHASWVNLPHVTQFEETDITALEELRGQLKQKAANEGIKLTPLAFVLRACARALQEFPQFNSSLDAKGENLVFKKYINIGFAADTPNGLVVPVLRNADHCDIYEIARQLAELAAKARDGKLGAAEMQGGTFTISSLGGIGGTAFTPIINAPEVAILGVSRSAMRPVFENGSFVPRLMLPLSLSYDHRVIDGALAARFIVFLAKTLSDPRALTEAVP